MAVNVNMKVLSLNGYYDSVTPFYQTAHDLENMPLRNKEVRERNLAIRNYPSGHMIYLDGPSRTAMKADLAKFYDSAVQAVPMQQQWDWLPPRAARAPRGNRLWAFSAATEPPPGTIPPPRGHANRGPSGKH
jgi:hypothetical protein